MNTRLIAATIAAGVAFVVGDAALWWASATVAPTVRPAFVGAASGLIVAVVGIGGAILGTRWSHHYQIRSTLKQESRIACGQLLRFANEFRSAQDNQEAAERELKRAQVERDSLGDTATKDQKEAVDAAVILCEAALKSANARVSSSLDDFSSASATVALVAPSIQSEVDELKRAIGGRGNFEEARTAFLKAALNEMS